MKNRRKCNLNRSVLVIGSYQDPVIQHFLEYISQTKQARNGWVFLWEETFGTTTHVNDIGWQIGERVVIPHDQVCGVFNRLVAQNRAKQSTTEAYDNIVIFCNYLMDEVYPNVLNRPKYGMSNYSKLTQLASIQPKVLKIPFSRQCVNKKWDDQYHELMWIFKSASSVRSITTLLSEKDKKRYIAEPVIFQEFLKGKNIRVHVIGTKCLAHYCISKKTDYRYAITSILRVKLPNFILEDCVEITKQLGLTFAGIDLIQTGLGWFILEANTAAGYSYFETDAREISQAITDYWAAV